MLDGPVGEQILEALEPQGFIGLAFYDSGSRSFYTDEQADQVGRRHEGHEDARAAIRHVGVDDAGDGRQPDADALCRGLHRAEDRRGGRRGEQLAVLQILAPLRGRQELQPDRAFDGAGAAGVLQDGLGHAAARKSRTSSARPPRNRCPICASCGTSAKRQSRKAVEAGGATIITDIDRKASSTPSSRSTTSSPPTPEAAGPDQADPGDEYVLEHRPNRACCERAPRTGKCRYDRNQRSGGLHACAVP